MRSLTRNDLLQRTFQMLAFACVSTAAVAQVPTDTSPAAVVPSVRDSLSSETRETVIAPGIAAGSRREDYLRSLQTVGAVRSYPWSLRGFSPRELDLLRPQTDSHPRAASREFNADPAWLPLGRPLGRALGLRLVPVTADGWFNSGFAFGLNDGAVWRGRGVTTAVSGGIEGRWGPLSLTIAPMVFWSQNREFELMSNGLTDDARFRDGQFWAAIDLPQRFGDKPYAVFDRGQSSLRLDTRFVTAGISTANQAWGPMTEFPFVLGDNAGGFLHYFVGTGNPANILVGTLHARVIYGQLGQSDYSPISWGEMRRFASGIVGVFSPRGLPTLEIGAGRFFHSVWPATGPTSREFRRPFESLFKSSLPREQQGDDWEGNHPENQLATVFFRWVFPPHGLEIYGETGRDDHTWDRRDLLLELEHAGTYGFGMRKVWNRPERMHVLRAETMNFQTRPGGLHRLEGGIFIHSPVSQGHTHQGQLLGSGFGIGSAGGTIVAYERHGATRGTTVSWSRLTTKELLRFPLMRPWEVRSDQQVDVQHVLEVEHRIDQNDRQIRLGLGGVYEFNRDFQRDAFNLMVSAGIDLFPGRRGGAMTEPTRASTAQ